MHNYYALTIVRYLISIGIYLGSYIKRMPNASGMVTEGFAKLEL